VCGLLGKNLSLHGRPTGMPWFESQLSPAAARIMHPPTPPTHPPTRPPTHPPTRLAAIPSNLKGRGWSDARAFSHTQLQKNPNAYFYRHVVPHEQQVGSQAGRQRAAARAGWLVVLAGCAGWLCWLAGGIVGWMQCVKQGKG
jgi:hypothetical protein